MPCIWCIYSYVSASFITNTGESGLVYRGYVVIGANKVLVAIKQGKVIKTFFKNYLLLMMSYAALLAVTDKERLLKEVSLLLTFSHPNVMPLIGLSFVEETPLIIMPFMSNGTVLSYVREGRNSLYILESSDGPQVRKEQ